MSRRAQIQAGVSPGMLMESSPNIVIVGGGIAGMAVAKSLSDNGLACTIVEKQAQLGGRARDWACMATGRCLRCFCCSAHDLAEAVESSPRVNVMKGWELASVTRSANSIRNVRVRSLGNGRETTLDADVLVVATGFDPYDPSEKGFWGYGRLDGVLTLGELNAHMRNDDVARVMEGVQGKARIAFFQCVGSRDSTIGANYCSQYCCKSAVRTALRLMADEGQWDVTIFYIDLQLAGKFADSLLHEAREKGVKFVQGVPGEIIQGPDGLLHVVREEAGRNIQESFHRIVLSIGQRPSAATDKIAAMIGLSVSEFGFLVSHDGSCDLDLKQIKVPVRDTTAELSPPAHHVWDRTSVLDSSRTVGPGVYLAGTCSGPRDIEATLEHAGQTAATVMADLERIRGERSPRHANVRGHPSAGPGQESLARALVIGGGLSGRIAARALVDLRIGVTLVEVGSAGSWLYGPGREADSSEIGESGAAMSADVEVLRLDQYPRVRREGLQFIMDLPTGTRDWYVCVVLTPSVAMSPPLPDLPAGVEVVSIERQPRRGEDVAFLLDYSGRTNPAAAQTAIRQAMDNTSEGGESVILFRHVPVPHLFGEKLYEAAQRMGVRFYRFGEQHPKVVQAAAGDLPHGRFRVSLTDAIETGAEVVLLCDRVFLVSGLDPSSLAREAIDIAGDDLDSEGFLLSESIHCHSGRSFRAGVFAVGEGTGETDLVRVRKQAASAALKARAWLLSAASGSDREVISLTEECTRCLTCFRICPHTAVSLQPGPARSLVRAAWAGCSECGICVAECPRLVLDQVSFPEEAIARFLSDLRQVQNSRPIVVYGCQRSAGRVASEIVFSSRVRFFAVPCAGRISETILWATFAAGVRGILVVGCHPGNCASNTGTDWASVRVNNVVEALGKTSSAHAVVGYATVAPNECARLRRLVEDFCMAIDARAEGRKLLVPGSAS